jgi:ubiquitin-protein ligase
VSRRVREITAIYTKEGQKIEICIVVPLEYPLRPPKIDVRKAVKMGEDKIKR